MNKKPKVVKRHGRWVIVPPKGYILRGYGADPDGNYGFAGGQAKTMDIARRRSHNFVKVAR